MLWKYIQQDLGERVDKAIIRWTKRDTSKRITQKAVARLDFRLANWEMDPLNEKGGNVRQAADLYWMAGYFARKSGNSRLQKRIEEGSQIFQGYDPSKSENPNIRRCVYAEKEEEHSNAVRKEIEDLEAKAKNELEKGPDFISDALELHSKAVELAKKKEWCLGADFVDSLNAKFKEFGNSIYSKGGKYGKKEEGNI